MEGELRSHFLAGVVIAALMACGTGTAQDATTVEVNATISAPDEAVSMAVAQEFNIAVRSPRGNDPDHFCLYNASFSGAAGSGVNADLEPLADVTGCQVDESAIALIDITCEAELPLYFSADVDPATNSGGRLLFTEDHSYGVASIVGANAYGAAIFVLGRANPTVEVACLANGTLQARIHANFLVPTYAEQGDFVLGTVTLNAEY
tara:strand:- start:35396 stop:36013 length:618 start_codon:yes stop_codon:yes gene_type:complete